MTNQKKNFLEVLESRKSNNIPFWFMRQAGRYLPEYMDLRAKAGSFLDMAYNPTLAAEVTLQPIRRFGMDAAIIFSDILVIPHALGQHLKFVQGEGPKLNPVRSANDIEKLNYDNFDKVLNPVYEALDKVKTGLQVEGYNNTALIGFCGAPWTVACYMVEGGGSKDFMQVKKLAFSKPEAFGKLIDLLVDSSSKYLINQVNAGAETLQIFDSWAGALDAQSFDKWVIEPTKRIIENVKKVHPDIPIIGFPRMSGNNYISYIQKTGVTAVSLDQSINTGWAADNLQNLVPVQGNLDPICLLTGGDALKIAAEKIISDLSAGNFIFNLGHGIHKDTPPEHVAQLSRLIQDYKL